MALSKPVFVHLVISCSKTGCETSCLFYMTMCWTKNQEFYYLRLRKWILWVSATVSKSSFALSLLLYPSLIYFNTLSHPRVLTCTSRLKKTIDLQSKNPKDKWVLLQLVLKMPLKAQFLMLTKSHKEWGKMVGWGEGADLACHIY